MSRISNASVTAEPTPAAVRSRTEPAEPTPGPWDWTMHRGGVYVIAPLAPGHPSSFSVARVYDVAAKARGSRAINAALIAAAPDLLAAAAMAELTLRLIDFQATCHNSADPAQPCNECPGCALSESLDALRSAIARAEGRQS